MLNVGEYTSPMDTCMASATYSVNPSLSRSKKKSAEKKKNVVVREMPSRGQGQG